jgi:hypothetical protein
MLRKRMADGFVTCFVVLALSCVALAHKHTSRRGRLRSKGYSNGGVALRSFVIAVDG